MEAGMVRKHDLTRAFGAEAAEVLLPVLNFELTVDELIERFEAADKRDRECHSAPGYADLALHVADDVLGTSGVEGWCSQGGRTGVSYCNAGDPYVPTVVLDRTGTFRIQAWENFA
jgi:hypothetical protein